MLSFNLNVYYSKDGIMLDRIPALGIVLSAL